MTAFAGTAPDISDPGPSVPGQSDRAQSTDITSLSLEQLMNVTVTSASKKEETLSQAPAAIYVITSEEIQRSGLSSLPEVLRLAPGLTVQQLNSHAWSVSTRGFNGFPNEKMLVLIDGRSVYDPLSGGVYWDVQDIRLEDIERIEVIRGPGGALWGANAVNGVINIITKPANETQGISMDTSLGVREGYQGSFRFGASLGKSFAYRIYGKSSFWDPAVDQTGADMFNGWHLSEGGIRADWDVHADDNLSLDLAGYQGHIRDAQWLANYGNFNMTNTSYAVAGGHVLARWRHSFSARSRANTLAYCDWTNRTLLGFGGEYRTTCDLEFQHDYTLNRHHSFIWGADFRSTADQTPVTPSDHLTPPDQRLNFFSGFGQYDFNIIPGRLRVTVGSKLEHSTYGGFAALPQMRAAWNPAGPHHIWAAVSRTSRTPTRNEHDNALSLFLPPQAPNGPPILIVYTGNPKIQNEYQTAYEAGYRYQYRQAWSLDVAAFYNSYSDLIYPDLSHAVTTFNPVPPYLQIATTFTNGSSAQTHGLEVSSKWKATRWWQLDLNVTENRGTAFSMGANPSHQFSIHSQVDLPKRFAFDSALYHWNPFTAAAASTVNVPTGNRVDVGVSWHAVRGLNLGVWGRNLQSAEHVEGTGASVATGWVRRSVVVKLSWDSNPEKKP
jgi:iron complex outermembrane receptor protein